MTSSNAPLPTRLPLGITRFEDLGLQIDVIDARPPLGYAKYAIFDQLLAMKVRDCIEVNRTRRSMENYIGRFRKAYELRWSFKIRVMGPGLCRVWRMA